MRSGVCVFCGKMGALALHSALDARLETKKKNLPDARDALLIPFFGVGSLACGKCCCVFLVRVLPFVDTASGLCSFWWPLPCSGSLAPWFTDRFL